MDKTPFSVYDILAYVSSGAVLAAAADYIWGFGLLFQKEIGPVLGSALVLLAYVAGHVTAHFSSFFMEHLFVGRFLQRPAVLLLGGAPRWKVLPWIFPNYHRELPKNVQKRIREAALARGCPAEGEELFLHAYPLVTANEKIQARLDIFLNQYGFARNMAFALFAAAVSLAIAHRYGNHGVQLRWAVLAGIGGLGMFYCYLRFFRQYSYELFIRYSGLPESESKAAAAGR